MAARQRRCDEQQFDRILLDAPCSATGVIRRHPDIKWLRRDRDIDELAALQREILAAIWPRLKSGGTLLYATCSVLPQENQQQIEAFLATHDDAVPQALPQGQLNGWQVFPAIDGGDGFFYAKLMKNSAAHSDKSNVSMKIIILGAGGAARSLKTVGENNDITVVDSDPSRLRVLQDKFDLRVVQGHGSHPRVLREAGAEDADMLVAVTSSDETNMIACQIAYSLFNTRIRHAEQAGDRQHLSADSVPARCRCEFCRGQSQRQWSKPITVGRWWAIRCQSCVNTCRISIPA